MSRSRALAWLLLEVATFTVSNVLIRFASVDLSAETMLFLRLLISAQITSLIMASNRVGPIGCCFISSNRNRLYVYLLCGVCGFMSSLLWIYSITLLPVATATTVFFTKSLFLAFAATFFLREEISWHQWAGYMFGMIGVVVLLSPGEEGLSLPGLLIGLASALLSAIAILLLKLLGSRDPAILSSWLRTTLIVPLAGLSACFAWTPPTTQALAIVTAISLLFVASQVALARGYGYLPLSQASALEYLRVVCAAAVGVFFFSERLSAQTLISAAVIVLSVAICTRRSGFAPAVRVPRFNVEPYSFLSRERGDLK
ncbi:Riboflavin transporter [Ensifer psoraleae]|uniref:DMT family transporter n=1 Tax=Sinorhizobium psoraleae TaxID=520838 RepID=UPI0015698EE9|nr:DMT family transporter [Sinorhizobium psoraleae]NRP70926.1 Riboflavin transporter [Sinorhizobium psoraleae]